MEIPIVLACFLFGVGKTRIYPPKECLLCRFMVWDRAAAMGCLVLYPGLAQVRLLQEVIREANIDKAVAFAETVLQDGASIC